MSNMSKLSNPQILVFSEASRLHVFKKDVNHFHNNETCPKNCTGFQEESVLEISKYVPETVKIVGELQLVSFDISSCPDCNFICCVDNQKRIYIFSNSDSSSNWEIFGRLELESRALSKIQFDQKRSHLVMTDKSGDVYVSAIQPDDDDLSNKIGTPKRILGHCSFITDTILTSDQKFILTSDRDHKIRMSQFPSGYNIEKYFLGHTEAVQSIMLLRNDTLLVSVSEIGRIIIWEDQKSGKDDDWHQYEKIKLGEEQSFIQTAYATISSDDANKIVIAIQHKSNVVNIYLINLKEAVWNSACQLLQSVKISEFGEIRLSEECLIEYNRETNQISQLIKIS